MLRIVGKTTNVEKQGGNNMPLTRNFKETVVEMAKNDPEFRVGLRTEAIECLTNNEVNVAKSLLRDYVNATLGFQELSELVEKNPSNLMRMLSEKGNPGISNLSQVLAAVGAYEGIEFHVSVQ